MVVLMVMVMVMFMFMFMVMVMVMFMLVEVMDVIMEAMVPEAQELQPLLGGEGVVVVARGRGCDPGFEAPDLGTPTTLAIHIFH
mgnify:CR=1